MIDRDESDWDLYAGVVEDNIDDVVSEIRAIDLIDLTSFIRMDCFPSIEDLVNSSTELFFRTEMLVFSWSASVDLRWGSTPTVTLGMEFRHPDVTLFFDLCLEAVGQAVTILGVVFEDERVDAVTELRAAFADARLSARSMSNVRGERLAPRGPSRRWS